MSWLNISGYNMKIENNRLDCKMQSISKYKNDDGLRMNNALKIEK